jgi:hypothetical protein
MKRNLAKGRAAMGAMMQRCKALRIYNPHIMLRLFDALVMPIISYGCEVWGPDVIAHYKWNMLNGEVELLHRSFMRMVVGTCKATPIPSMMRLLDRQPVMMHWIQRIGRFLNRVSSSQKSGLLHNVLVDSRELHINHDKGWYNKVVSMVQHCGDIEEYTTLVNSVDDIVAIDIAKVLKQYHDKLQDNMWSPAKDAHNVALQCVQQGSSFGVVRTCPDAHRSGFKLLKYKQWFMPDGGTTTAETHNRSGFAYHLHCYHHIRTVARFILGVHWLNTEKMRAQGMPRSQRLCPCCVLDREDEMHVLMCPAYQKARSKFPVLLGVYHDLHQSTDVDKVMRDFVAGLEGHEWKQLADFLCITISIREKFITPPPGGPT